MSTPTLLVEKWIYSSDNKYKHVKTYYFKKILGKYR